MSGVGLQANGVHKERKNEWNNNKEGKDKQCAPDGVQSRNNTQTIIKNSRQKTITSNRGQKTARNSWQKTSTSRRVKRWPDTAEKKSSPAIKDEWQAVPVIIDDGALILDPTRVDIVKRVDATRDDRTWILSPTAYAKRIFLF